MRNKIMPALFVSLALPAICMSSEKFERPPTRAARVAGPNHTNLGGLIIQENALDTFPRSYVFSHSDGKSRPGIVLLHGSSGGSLTNMWVHALLLAGQGFNVMTFCWWDCERDDVRFGPQPILAHIELEKTVAALTWFKNSKYVGPKNKLGLFGISKGAEQALILGSFQDRIPVALDAIVVHAPSDVTTQGVNTNWEDSRCWMCDMNAKRCASPKNWNPGCGPLNYGNEDPSDLPAWEWHGVPLRNNTRIEIEKFAKPVLITCGVRMNSGSQIEPAGSKRP
jgi:hypothetical protein